MARESASERLERRRREEGTNYGEQDLQKAGRAVKKAGKALFGIEGDSASQKLERARREEAAAKRRPTSDLKGTKLNRERGDSSKQLNPKTMTAAERKANANRKNPASKTRTPKVTVSDETRPSYARPASPPSNTVKAPRANVGPTSSAKGKAPTVNRNVKIAKPKIDGPVAKPKIDGPVAKKTSGKGGKTLTDLLAVQQMGTNTKAAEEKILGGKAPKKETGKSTFRQRRLARLKKRLKASESEGRQSRLKKRVGRVEDRIEKGKKKKPKKMMGGGMAMAEKPYKHGKEVKSYKVGKTVKSSKLPGAGIESKGTRPCQMR